jgi:hypothetical protein
MSTSTSLTVATLCLIACFSFANAEYYRGEGTAYSGERRMSQVLSSCPDCLPQPPAAGFSWAAGLVPFNSWVCFLSPPPPYQHPPTHPRPPAAGYREKDETGKNSCGFGKLDDRWERFYGKLRRRRLTDGLQGC